MPLDATPAPIVNCTIVYNPLDTSDRLIMELEWTCGRSLADYLGGLPHGLHWGVCLNAEPVEAKHWASITPAPNDWITVVPIPEGGGGGGSGKNVMRLVAMIAVSVIANYYGPMLAAEIPGAMAAGPTLTGAAGYATPFGSALTGVMSGGISAAGGATVTASFPVWLSV